MLIVSCGNVNNELGDDTTPDNEVDVTLPSEEEDLDDVVITDDLHDDAWSEDDSDWDLDGLEEEWGEARERSAELDFAWLTEDEASELASENGVPFRVTMRDGEMLPVTMDYVPGRINAQIEDGVVTSVSVE